MNDRERIDNIKTHQDLARFVKHFCQEYQTQQRSWENGNLESFLTALAAWLEDMDGFYLNQKRPMPETPEWKTFAEMLAAARDYE